MVLWPPSLSIRLKVTMLPCILVLVLTLLPYSSCTSDPSDPGTRLEYLEEEWMKAKAEVDHQTQTILALTAQLRSRESAVAHLKETLRGRRQVSDNSIGFTARLNHAISHLNAHQAIVFDQVVTNIGRAYDASSGLFVCPYSGLYEFAATVVSNGDHKDLDAEIVHQGNRVARLHSTVYGYDQGTQVVVVHCVEGDKVWVRHFGTADSAIMPAGYSTFAGHLIHMDA